MVSDAMSVTIAFDNSYARLPERFFARVSAAKVREPRIVKVNHALAAVTTGETVIREQRLPGAVLTRVAASHIRVGTFEYFAARNDLEAITELTKYTLARHHPSKTLEPRDAHSEALRLLDCVIEA